MKMEGVYLLLLLLLSHLLNGRLVACLNNFCLSSKDHSPNSSSSSSSKSLSGCHGILKPRKNSLPTQSRVTPARQDLGVKGIAHLKRVLTAQISKREPEIYFTNIKPTYARTPICQGGSFISLPYTQLCVSLIYFGLH
jgi:hypothetical protein